MWASTYRAQRCFHRSGAPWSRRGWPCTRAESFWWRGSCCWWWQAWTVRFWASSWRPWYQLCAFQIWWRETTFGWCSTYPLIVTTSISGCGKSQGLSCIIIRRQKFDQSCGPAFHPWKGGTYLDCSNSCALWEYSCRCFKIKGSSHLAMNYWRHFLRHSADYYWP